MILILNSPSPVTESRKNSCVQRKFLFHVLIWTYDFQKNFGGNYKRSTSPKIHDFKKSGKSPWCQFSYVGSKFKCLQLVYRWERNFIRINIALRTRVQEETYLELLIENRKGIFLQTAGFLS